MKLKLYKIFFTILIIIACIILALIIMKQRKSDTSERINRETVETFSSLIETSENENSNEQKTETIKMNGYAVIGIVKIPKINLQYPILDVDTYNPEETKEPMKEAIVKYWGGNVNDYGNLSIAGHNNYNGTMFGKNKKLKKDDIVELTDLKNQTIKYKIYDIFVTDPNDIEILKTQDNSIREVTLITCTNGNKQRLILKAREEK